MAMKRNKRTKTVDKLLSLSTERSNEIGIEVYRLMEHELKYIVSFYVYRYRNTVESVFGWDEDDLRQHIATILWKGVATFDPSKNIKMTTYLSGILFYQMGNLSYTIQNKKHSSLKIVFPDQLYDTTAMIDFTSSEDWASYTQSFKILMGKMSELEMKVLVSHLLKGDSISTMQQDFKVNKQDIVSAIKSLTHKMKNCIEESER
jgi:DNA-directed RNA polymerase specialized sigma subunit